MSDWIHISKVSRRVEDYIDKRRKGLIKSLRTGFPKLDSCNIGGFEWGSTITVGGRPSVGKSAFSECMIRGFLENNEPDFDILDFSWEMSPDVILRRNLSNDFRRSYKYMCSAQNNTLSDEEMHRVSELLRGKYENLPIWYVEKPNTIDEFAKIVRSFRDEKKRNLVVRVDHTILAKMSRHHGGDRVTMLLDLLGTANDIKKESNVIFLFLTQMNREFVNRQESYTDKAYPQQSDVFGGDATSMYSETMILLNRPAMFNISFYGNRKSGVPVDKHDMFAHIVKSRNAEPNLMIRFIEDFENMSIKEVIGY